MLSRDFDFSDRFTVVGSSAAPAVTGAINWALFAKLGVDGIVQATVLPSGWLRVQLHDVGLKSVRNQKDFRCPPAHYPRPGVSACMAWLMLWRSG